MPASMAATVSAPAPLGFGARFAQVWWREAALLRQRPLDLAWLSWVPLLGVGLLWWIFSAGLPTALPIGVLDQDHSALSRQVSRFLDAAPGLQLAAQYENEAEVERALRRGEVHAVLLIPPTLSRDIKRGQRAQLTLLHNAQLGTHSGLIQKEVRTVVGTLGAGIELSSRTKRGETSPAARAHLEPLRVGGLTLFNTSLDYERYLAAALIPALLHILAMTAGAWGVGRELRDRSVGDWLPAGSSWAQALAALLGKLAWPALSLGLLAAVTWLGLTAGRGWSVPGSLLGSLFALEVFLGLSLLMGALAALATRSLRTALSATGFITAPAFAFSGVGFPLLAMPPLAQVWAQCLPYTHYIRTQTEQLHLGAPWALSAPAPLWMLLISLLMAAGAAALLRRVAAQPERWGAR
ncbi:ABC transporter permease [Curvibacter sp. RS43]|uniref:ABC transporter permease n=1 Tax=Curvibacter microcysteis TaxID=3026419 RepID=UPI00235DE01B|nr:ABC transporter permease [Curvibacter sp. RS43]MDD0809357.1 ABC transporter permease [Curvibacter sp. RS43]